MLNNDTIDTNPVCSEYELSSIPDPVQWGLEDIIFAGKLVSRSNFSKEVNYPYQISKSTYKGIHFLKVSDIDAYHANQWAHCRATSSEEEAAAATEMACSLSKGWDIGKPLPIWDMTTKTFIEGRTRFKGSYELNEEYMVAAVVETAYTDQVRQRMQDQLDQNSRSLFDRPASFNDYVYGAFKAWKAGELHYDLAADPENQNYDLEAFLLNSGLRFRYGEGNQKSKEMLTKCRTDFVKLVTKSIARETNPNLEEVVIKPDKVHLKWLNEVANIHVDNKNRVMLKFDYYGDASRFFHTTVVKAMKENRAPVEIILYANKTGLEPSDYDKNLELFLYAFREAYYDCFLVADVGAKTRDALPMPYKILGVIPQIKHRHPMDGKELIRPKIIDTYSK